MTSRFSPTPWLLGLAVVTALSGCGERLADQEFKHHFHTGDTSGESFVTPVGVPIETWALVGGTFQSLEMKNRGGGLLQALNVPEGPLWYRNGGRWIVSEARSVLWQQHSWGRMDIALTPFGTRVDTTVTGLAPWSREEGSRHQLNVWASSNGYSFPVLNESVEIGAQQHLVTLRDLAVETDGLDNGLPALDGGKGDSLHLAQMLTTSLTDAAGTTVFDQGVVNFVLRGATLSGADLKFPDGVGGGDLAPEMTVPLSEGTMRTLDLDLRGSGFDEVILAAGGTASGTSAATRVLIRPDVLNGQARTSAARMPFAVSAVALTPEAGAPAARLTWSDAATSFAPQQLAYTRTYVANGVTVEAGVVTTFDAATSQLSPAPLVGAPGPIQIDNQPVVEGLHVISPTPLISWTAPTVGTAHGYEVRIVRTASNGSTISESLLTRETQVRVPPPFFIQDEEGSYTFTIVVVALHDPSEGFPETRQLAKVPFGFAARATASFTAAKQ